ncbi:hypothetical protein DM02DRAFT_690622 [Periconia macrospinosa]|uniref:Uncharacterized protein n=1 Tax=Periconia macrospinosa TaxID=97972 RepID=A0A2V1EC80_9PLEO|nr:hypothetical protein DM02DRAFT_690622 [Periconia macrospinosa]
MSLLSLPNEILCYILELVLEERRNNHHGISLSCVKLYQSSISHLYRAPFLANKANPRSIIRFLYTLETKPELKSFVMSLDLDVNTTIGISSVGMQHHFPAWRGIVLGWYAKIGSDFLARRWIDHLVKGEPINVVGFAIMRLPNLEHLALSSSITEQLHHGLDTDNVFDDLPLSVVRNVLPKIKRITSRSMIEPLQLIFPTATEARFALSPTLNYSKIDWKHHFFATAYECITSVCIDIDIRLLIPYDWDTLPENTIKDFVRPALNRLRKLQNFKVCLIDSPHKEDGEDFQNDAQEIPKLVMGKLKTFEIETHRLPSQILDDFEAIRSFHRFSSSLEHITAPQLFLRSLNIDQLVPSRVSAVLQQTKKLSITRASDQCHLIAMSILSYKADVQSLEAVEVEYESEQDLLDDAPIV